MKRGWLLACLTLIFCVITCGMVYADGSRDFYPSKIKGNRAFLVSHEGLRVRNASLPFLTLGTHYVYVRAGEKLVVASSAQGIGQGKMILTDPNNKIYDSGNSSVGRISDNGNGTRAAELAGPRRGYAAYEVYVNEESAGIWKVEFIPPSGKADPEVGQNKVPNILADANWTQTNEYYIAAWDISVRNKADEDWIQGRVFTNNLNLQISDEQIENPDQAFYGVNYVLTNDGYVYRVQGNGSNGIAFSYFVNSQGFLDENNKPLYRSIDNSRLDGYKIQDPRSVDKGGSITHKILYTLPDENMPDIGYGAVPDGKTWLFKKNEDIEIQDIKIIGVEGTPGYVSLRGSNIRFVTNVAASYKIFISSVHADYAFEPVELFVNAKTGENSIFWNGRDGNDKPLPIGEDFPIKLKIQKLGGEVHFPYIDMEINPKGIIIELLDKDLSSVKSDIVYWDDRDLTPGLPSEQSNPLTNLEGIRSTINGHIWGTYSKSAPGKGSNSFGDEKAMDTWTYIYDAFVEKEMDITVKMADLAVEFSNPQNKKIDLGELIHYEIKISNYGPSDVKDAKFDFKVPEGFKVESIAYTGGCGLVQNPNKYNALIDLPAHCEIFLKIMLKANKVADHVYGKVRAEASILRPADVIDPDATSVKPFDGKPRTAQGECLNNGLQVACNNIAYHADYFLLEPPGERGALFLIKEALHIDANRDQFAQEGEIVKYTFTIINSGLVNVSELKLIDPMLSASPLTLLNNSMPANDIQILTVDYVIKKSDLDRGYVTNSALISGLNPRGFEVSDRSGISTSDDIPTTISLPKKPQIALIKSVMNRGTANNGLFTLGDIITYEFQIRHKGDYAVENLMFSDPNISKDYIPLPKYSIHNETIRFQLNYVVTDNDIDAGYVKNSATVTGFDALYSTKQTDVSGLTFDDNEPTIVYTPTRIKAQDDVAKVYENESVIIDVLMNDQKGSSPIVKSKIKFIQLPTNGNVVANPDGSILYTPYNEYFGADGFTYQVADENGLWSTIAFVAVTVLEAIPRAVDDFVETYYNRSVDIHVLANDKSTGVNIDYNSVEIISFPQLGTLVHLGNGVFTYSPNRFTTGVDYFTYTVKDVNGGVSNIAMVTITIHGFLIPNVFTPNDDGYNDKFKILGTHTFDQTALTVIDKYGIMMYQSQDYRNDWHGDNLTDGTYFVLIEGYVEGQKTFTHKGTITIIRKITY